MIIYEKTKREFIEDCSSPNIKNILIQAFLDKGMSAPNNKETRGWYSSLKPMRDVLLNSKIHDDVTIGLEYHLSYGGRIDFLMLGDNNFADEQENLVVVELKAWSEAYVYDENSSIAVKSDMCNGREPSKHPCYQAAQYKYDLESWNKTIQDKQISIYPLGYCFNLDESYRETLRGEPYTRWEKIPLFLGGDDEEQRMAEYLESIVSKPALSKHPLKEIDEGAYSPSKELVESLKDILNGNDKFFILRGNQDAIGAVIDKTVRDSLKDGKKRTLIIKGGPGTGKSVLAVKELAKWASTKYKNKYYKAIYYTKNSTPRKCYEYMAAKGDVEMMARFKELFPSQIGIADNALKENSVTLGLFDEAHRIQDRPYQYKGKNLLSDLIYQSLVSVFFVDESQLVTVKDIGSVKRIKEEAIAQGSIFIDDDLTLDTQFRCNGSDGYVSFLDHLLGIKSNESQMLTPPKDYDIRVIDDIQDMYEAVKAKNTENRARIVAGYCYDWNSQNDKNKFDVIIKSEHGLFQKKWNNPAKRELWAVEPNRFEEIGCIHTCQGMEFEYVGVIIGNDLQYRDGEIVTNQSAISDSDNTSGIRKCKDKDQADRFIRNTYRVLLSRGMKGCYIYCEDAALREYLLKVLKQ